MMANISLAIIPHTMLNKRYIYILLAMQLIRYYYCYYASLLTKQTNKKQSLEKLNNLCKLS